MRKEGMLSVAAPGADPRAVTVKRKEEKAMIDHIYLPVSDLERSSKFYKKGCLSRLASTCPTSSLIRVPRRGFANQ